MLGFLKSIFGEEIILSSYGYPKNTPIYIRDNYNLQLLVWGEYQCVLLAPKDDSWRLPALKKQYMNFQKICSMPCALYLGYLTVLQRKNLVESRIPFLSESQLVYLPFWGAFFIEKRGTQIETQEKMAPGTQLVFLYLYYTKKDEHINLTGLSRKLSLSKATCTRAIRDLNASGIIAIKNDGRNKWIIPQFDKQEFLKKGYNRMKSPVDHIIYVKNVPGDQQFLQSGVQALASISMVGAKESDRGIAVSKRTASEIPVDNIISKRVFDDFGGAAIEVWSYDPALLSNGRRVDDISLLLSLAYDPDERIQMGLDEIREKYGLPIKYEE